MTNERTASALRVLIGTCLDGERGYQEAAAHVASAELAGLFHSFARQRGLYAAELREAVIRLGCLPTLAEPLTNPPDRRGWVNIKAIVQRSELREIIAEAEQGEDLAVAQYREALARPLPADIHKLVHEQYQQIQNAHDHIRQLDPDHRRYRLSA